MNKSFPSIVVTGATGTGKSSLAISLAEKLSRVNKNSEIISADAVQVYKQFDIGSGKLPESDLAKVKHHLISVLEPQEKYSAGKFGKDARDLIKQINNEDKYPIVVGGTALYVNSIFSTLLDDSWHVLDGESFLTRAYLDKNPKDLAYQNIRRLLEIIDSESHERIEPSDLFRIHRAVKLALASGTKNSLIRKMNIPSEEDYPTLIFILERDRDNLYDLIDKRVIQMMDFGWFEEVTNLIKNHGETLPALGSIGYKTLLRGNPQRFQADILYAKDLINEVQRDTRRFAKRQITWWRHQPDKLGWVNILEVENEIFSSSVNSAGKSFNKDSQNFLLKGNSEQLSDLLFDLSSCFFENYKQSHTDDVRSIKNRLNINSGTYYCRLLITD